jgi:hypothetical protein
MKLAFSTLGCPDWSLDEVIAATRDSMAMTASNCACSMRDHHAGTAAK